MRLVRSLERRLEQLVDGLAGRVFRGQLHPVELGARLVREADLAAFEGEAGPTVPNRYIFRVNPDDLGGILAPAALRHELGSVLETMARERGWRLEGRPEVAIDPDPGVAPGTVECHGEVFPSELPAWGRLTEADGGTRHPIRYNRTLIGRLPTADVVLSNPDVSRRHALLWREGDRIWLADIGSSNGTFLDGRPVTEPMEVPSQATITLGTAQLTYRQV